MLSRAWSMQITQHVSSSPAASRARLAFSDFFPLELVGQARMLDPIAGSSLEGDGRKVVESDSRVWSLAHGRKPLLGGR